MPTPEPLVRQHVDRLLEAAGWAGQDRDALNLGASLGVAVREFPTKVGPADYLLFAGQKMMGVAEAKPAGTTLSGVAEQSANCSSGIAAARAAWCNLRPLATRAPALRATSRTCSAQRCGAGAASLSKETQHVLQRGIDGSPPVEGTEMSVMKGKEMRRANANTHQICRSLLQKAVRRGHSQLASHVATHLKDNEDTAWLRGRIAVIAFEECWPLAAEIKARMSIEELFDVLGRVAAAAKIKDAAGLGSLAHALSAGDRSALVGLQDDQPVRLIAAAIERPSDFWSWIEGRSVNAAAQTLVESARRSYRRGGWPWDRAFMLAAAYLAVSQGAPELPQVGLPSGEFPYWVALDKHTPGGREVLRAVAREAGLPWQQVFWCSFYFESAVVNDDCSVAWWRRETEWRLGKTGLAYDQAQELWDRLRPRVAESLAGDAAGLKAHLGVEDTLTNHKEPKSAVSHQLTLFET